MKPDDQGSKSVTPRVRKTYLVTVYWTYGNFDFVMPTRSAVESMVDEIFETHRFHSIDDDGQETIVPLHQINFIRIVPPGAEEESEVTAVGLQDESEVAE